MILSPGTRLGPYEIVAPLGAGGMGEVWKARDTRLDRSVAVKVLPEEFANSGGRSGGLFRRPGPGASTRRSSLGQIVRRLLAAIVVLVPSIALAAPPPLRVLFIGNSLTYANGLPAMVERIAGLDGRRIETRMLAQPNYSLEDHLASNETTRALGEEWDWIVLQQGPSSLAESRAALQRDAKKVASLAPTSRIALLMVWPPVARASAWDEVEQSYRLSAQSVHGLLIPAGTNLRRALGADPSLPLLTSDGFHPAEAGTYLVALTVYRTLTNRLPPRCDDLRTARRIAAATLALTPRQLMALVDAVR